MKGLPFIPSIMSFKKNKIEAQSQGLKVAPEIELCISGKEEAIAIRERKVVVFKSHSERSR